MSGADVGSAPEVWSGADAVLVGLAGRGQQIVERAVRRIFTEIPAYASITEPAFRADVGEHLTKHYECLIRHLKAERRCVREHLLFTRMHTARRVGRIPVAEYMRAWIVFQETFWSALLEEARDEETSQAVVAFVSPLLDYINLSSTYATELYAEIQEFDRTGGEMIRRNLVEDLVAARPVASGPTKDAGGNAGLGPDIPCLVVVAVPRTAIDDEHVLWSAAGAVARACATRLTPLWSLRSDEFVVIVPAQRCGTGQVVTRLNETYEHLNLQNVALAIGVSTVHPGLAGVAVAHREARGAADCLGPHGGVLALPALSSFEYLVSFRDDIAERLISPALRRFVREDVERGGVLTNTVLAYVSCNLNVKALSEREYVHTNTAHYRLHRVAEQTGLDLRNIADVLELVIAIRLARPLGDRPPGTWVSSSSWGSQGGTM
jgi:hypothetical protein